MYAGFGLVTQVPGLRCGRGSGRVWVCNGGGLPGLRRCGSRGMGGVQPQFAEGGDQGLRVCRLQCMRISPKWTLLCVP